ncbi:uncharacterized protein LOC116133238 [Pistacia vera]|uniref:uncharacterized protein LOC116133238 n=1 Tax=Pistacia vera TaxID=55513 RepID=UPI0012633B59|nr:uncharacterized protein LOC116133238 [Pistacia vera]XP_031274811.1 uncharacterized protein LOC116133238 [Pistacia vera]
MSQQSQGTSSFSPADAPVKRKRGRPRKDDTQIQGENLPGSDIIKKNKQIVGASSAAIDDMVGQVVSGVIEGSFDAGYLLNVKVGDTETQLRGVVFLPGWFTPITAANDVAPNAKMYKRKEVPIPVQNLQTRHHPSEQIKKQATESKIDAPKLPDRVLPSELQSGIPVVGENQSASVIIPLADNLPMNEPDLSLGEKMVLQQMSETESRLERQTASIIAQLKQDKVVEQDILQQGTNMDIDTSKESEPMSIPFVDVIPSSGNASQVSQVEHQALSSDLMLNDLVHNEVVSLNIENNQTTVSAEPKSLSSEPIGISILMQKRNLKHNPTPLFVESEPICSEPIGMNNIIDGQNSPKKVTVQDPQSELDNKTVGGNDTSLPVDEAAPCIAAISSFSPPVTSLSVMMFDGEAIASEPEPGTEGSAFPRTIETQICSSAAATNDAESDIKDAITHTHLDLSSGVNLSGSG